MSLLSPLDPDILQAKSFPAHDHPARRLASCSVHAVISLCRGTAGRTGHRHVERDGTALVLKFERLIAGNLRHTDPRQLTCQCLCDWPGETAHALRCAVRPRKRQRIDGEDLHAGKGTSDDMCETQGIGLARYFGAYAVNCPAARGSFS